MVWQRAQPTDDVKIALPRAAAAESACGAAGTGVAVAGRPVGGDLGVGTAVGADVAVGGTAVAVTAGAVVAVTGALLWALETRAGVALGSPATGLAGAVVVVGATVAGVGEGDVGGAADGARVDGAEDEINAVAEVDELVADVVTRLLAPAGEAGPPAGWPPQATSDAIDVASRNARSKAWATRVRIMPSPKSTSPV